MMQKNSSNPSHYFKLYKSSASRAPRKKFFNINKDISFYVNKKELLKNFKINNNLLNYKKNKQPLGQKIFISGKVTNVRGKPLKDIIIEIWQANASGKYRDYNDKHKAPIDPNFFGYGISRHGHKSQKAK